MLQRKGGFDAHKQLDFLSRHEATNVFTTPTAMRSMMSIEKAGEKYPQKFRIVCSAAEAGPELDAARAVGERIAAEDVPVLGPAPLFRRQSRHRAQLLIRSRERAAAIIAVREAVEAVAAERAHAAVSFAVDVDPQ